MRKRKIPTRFHVVIRFADGPALVEVVGRRTKLRGLRTDHIARKYHWFRYQHPKSEMWFLVEESSGFAASTPCVLRSEALANGIEQIGRTTSEQFVEVIENCRKTAERLTASRRFRTVNDILKED